MANIVLVHGAFHGGWCWQESAKLLRSRGHQVYTPTLTGVGEKSHLLDESVNLSTHIADIVNLIHWEELTDVVLVGHSYGGMPVTGAADKCSNLCSALLYLDAYTPDDGKSGVDYIDAGRNSAGVIDFKGSIPSPDASKFGLTGEVGVRANRLLTPHPVATFAEPIALTGKWRNIPVKAYCRATQYEGAHLDDFYRQAKADGDWTTFEYNGGHNPMMVDPLWFVEALERYVLQKI